MSAPRVASLTAAVLALAALPGCVTYKEDISFDEKGAAKIGIVYVREQRNILEKGWAAVAEKNPLEDRKALAEGIPTGCFVKEHEAKDLGDSKKQFKIAIELDDANKFQTWQAGENFRRAYGTISLKKVDEVWIFERRFAGTREEIEEAKKKAIGSTVLFTLRGPGKLVKSKTNALEFEGENACTWKGSLPELLEGKDGSGTVMTAHFDVGTPYTMMNAVIVAGAVVMLLVAAFVFMSKKPKTAPPAPESEAKTD